jgi:hypothetical protein
MVEYLSWNKNVNCQKKKPITGPYTEPVESNQQPQNLFLQDPY